MRIIFNSSEIPFYPRESKRVRAGEKARESARERERAGGSTCVLSLFSRCNRTALRTPVLIELHTRLVVDVHLASGNPTSASGGPLDVSTWATTKRGTDLRSGTIIDPDLAGININWTGALATLNVGYRFLTWTRTVLEANATSFRYNSTCESTGRVGGRGGYLDDWEDNLYFLSGVIGALNSPGEWHFDESTRVLSVMMPDQKAPAGRVGVKVKEYCVDLEMNDATSAPVALVNLSMVGCTFRLRNCQGCAVSGVNVTFPSYRRTIPMRGEEAGGVVPAGTLLQGNDSVVERTSLRYANNAGLKVRASTPIPLSCSLLSFPTLCIVH